MKLAIGVLTRKEMKVWRHVVLRDLTCARRVFLQ